MTYAIILDGVPMQLRGGFTDNSGTKHPANVLSQWSPPELAAINVHPITEGTIPDGHTVTGSALEWNGETVTRAYTTEAIPLADLKAVKLAALKTRRGQAEEGGITVGGIDIPTDERTQGRVDQICKALDDGDITGPIDFSVDDGWQTLNEATLRAIKAAGAQHIQACFSRQRALSSDIAAAADLTALNSININSGWPQ